MPLTPLAAIKIIETYHYRAVKFSHTYLSIISDYCMYVCIYVHRQTNISSSSYVCLYACVYVWNLQFCLPLTV